MKRSHREDEEEREELEEIARGEVDAEEEQRRREEEESRREEERRREHAERLAIEEERRRKEEERERLEAIRQEHSRRVDQNLVQPIEERDKQQPAYEQRRQDQSEREEESCLEHEFHCNSGECIDRRRVCDTRSDCQDASDEAHCHRLRPHAPPTIVSPQSASQRRDDRPPDFGGQELTITVYPQEQEVREGQDAVFDCRARTADGTAYPEVRWSRVGEPLPPRAYESTGRLTIRPVHQSDSGAYVCTATHMGTMKDAHVQLNVLPSGPQEMQGGLSLSGLCRADERACGNNECVKADYVCDGEPDCRDRSDEQNCPSLRQCEPNEFKCNNGRCVQKMWLCDGDDDCGDNSDEQQCRQKASSDGCGPTEFRCRDGRQCVLSSFHCDGTNDCQDGSDEVGCVQPTVVEAPETNKQVPAGGTFQLTCRAVAVPEPYINWRLNWGPVCDPPRCVQHSEGGLGTLTVNNAQPLDQGAYTCEAINVKGRVLATPDCIVRIVNIPAPSYEPRPPAQVQCDMAGSVSLQPGYGGQCQCKALVTGPSCNQCVPGSYHLHNKAPQGCLKCFCFGITDQCRSSTWYRSKDKLTFNGDPQGVTLSDFDERDIEQNARFDYIYPGMITYSNGRYGESVKYWRMPQRFLGNKLSSYGGELAFDMQHSCTGSLITEPLVVIKGNRITLLHRSRNGVRSTADRTERITIDTYENNYEHEDGRPASREDLMMVLADLESFLIRATHCDGQRSTSLGDVSWEIAVDRDTQDRLAVEVEQCSCPPGYTGLSCEDCAPGYERSGQGPYLGTCVPARQGPQCSAAGAISTQPSYAGTCQCKTYATGPLCDQCPPNSFYMSAENPHGCIPCFCSGVTQQCSSSGYSRAVVEINYPQGSRDQLEVTTSDAHTPFQPQSRPQLTGRDITFSSFYETPGQTLYWKMPTPFLGNKVTSYGGTLKYVFRYSGAGPLNGDPDVILRGNDITLYFKNRQPTQPERDNAVEVKLFEDRWHRVDGQQATREHLLMTLADLDALLIKMNYLDDCSSSSLISVSLEHAEPRHNGGQIAYEVEQCVCPPGYIGTSCEDCAPGYSRTGGGLYLGLCERCECHGHATQCDKEHGFCVDCQHNTEGDQCERCKPGFVGDARRGTPHDCQPAATRPPCNCNNHSPRGCDSFGRCLMCEHNTEGYHCEQCKKGFYGDATRGTPFDCTPCPCPATSDCFLDAYGQVQCRNCPAGFSGRLCDECAPGYTRSRTHGGRDCEPIGRVGPSDVVFVPTPEAPLRVQIDPPKNLQVPRGGRAQWYCHIIGHSGPNLRLEWTKVGTNTLPDSAIQTNGQLVIDDVRESDSGQYRCTATGPHQFATDDATLVVTKPQPVNPVVDPQSQTVDEGASARFRCHVPGNPDAQLRWRKEDGSAFGYGVTDSQGVLSFARVVPSDAGAYVCTAQGPRGVSPIDSSPAYLGVNPRRPSNPVVEPPTQTVNEGDPAKFRCYLPYLMHS
uniref:Basement membrane proteoglycan n=1 Tax=Ascaris suum TaxID=6253 RepID=F1KPK5_ASCSU